MGKAIYQEVNGKKTCTGCHKDQPIGMYGITRKKNGRDVQRSKCTDCLQRATEEWRQNHQDRYKEYRKKYQQTNQEIIRAKSYLQNANYRGLTCELSPDQFIALFNQPCDYCGDQDALNGVDRIDNSQGYISGNVAPCCSICNTMKKKMTKDEFLSWVNKIHLHQASLNRREHHA